MLEDSFGLKEIINQGWIGFVRNWKLFIGLACLFIFSNLLLMFVIKGLPLRLDFLLFWAANTYLGLSITKAALIAAAGKRASKLVLQNTLIDFLRFLIVPAAFYVGVLLGVFNTVFIFSSIIIVALFLPLPFIVTNESLPIIAAIRKTIDITVANFVTLLLFCLLSVIFCIVFFPIAFPVIVISSAAIYYKLA
jgi:hypothetical protein